MRKLRGACIAACQCYLIKKSPPQVNESKVEKKTYAIS
jgi:hypothetical protein